MVHKKRHLRIVIGSLGIGGAEQHLAQILPELAKKGWNIRVLTLKTGGALESLIRDHGIQVLSPPPCRISAKCPKILQRFISVLSGFKFLFCDFRRYPSQITHFFLPEAYIMGMAAALCARDTGVKLMSRRSLNNYQSKYPGIGWLEKRLHRRLSTVLANSSAVLAQLRDQEGVPFKKLKLIYNGINLEPFDAPLSRQAALGSLGIPEHAFIMIIVANLIPYKGHEDLLKALFLINRKLPRDWRLLCVGNQGQIERKLKQQADDLGLSDHILWLGLRRDVPVLLRASNLGILCSHQEGFANAILEGMAASLPMVVTNVGGNAEAVIDHQTGFIVPPQTPQALAEAILKLANAPKTAKSFGQAGYKRVKGTFGLDACVEAYEKLYEEIS